VINCTGLRGAPEPDGDDLVARLARKGAVRPDPLGLGLEVNDGLQAIGVNSAPTAGLFAVGPLTRGAFWEAIAVPDLRVHTALIAAAAVESLRIPEVA